MPKPPDLDSTFWWANSYSWTAPSTTADFRKDGLHFNGGSKKNEDNGDLYTSSGVLATFTLQPKRRPASRTGFFTSSPHVELFGGFTAYASDWGFTHGHGIASCDLVLRQSVFQFGLGQAPNGDAAHLFIAEADSTQTLINFEDTGFSRTVGLSGYTFVPPVRSHELQLIPGDLQAEIEVKFVLYLKSGGALVWCAPECIVRTFQWSLVPDA